MENIKDEKKIKEYDIGLVNHQINNTQPIKTEPTGEKKKKKISKLRIFIIVLGILMLAGVTAYMFSGDDNSNIKLTEEEIAMAYEGAYQSQSMIINDVNNGTWNPKRASGDEAGLTFWKSGTDKKVELGWIPSGNSCAGQTDKILYGRNGLPIKDDKNKDITLKCESAKCSGANCYHISLTTAQAINIDDYIKLGNNSFIAVYSPSQFITIDENGANITCGVQKYISGNWNPIEALWIDGNEWGLNDTYNVGTNESYRITCDSSLPYEDIGNNQYQYGIAIHDFDKTCQPEHNCSFENVDSDTMRVTLTSTGFIDPTYSLGTMGAGSYGINATAEPNGCSHLLPINSAPYDSLVAYWSFDCDALGTSGVRDITLNDNDGTFTAGAYPTISSGRYGMGAYFDGVNDYITYGSPSSLQIGDKNMSISMWVNTPKTTASYTALVDKGGNTEGGFAIMSRVSDDNILVFRNGGSTNWDTGYTLPASTWTHLVVTIDSADNVYLYANGTYIGTDTGFNITTATGKTWQIGRWASTYYLNGSIDDVMIFNSTLTQQQITDIYNNQSQRFYPTGEIYQPMTQIVLNGTENSVNYSLYGFETNMNTAMQTKIGYWDISKGYNESDSGLVAYYHADNVTGNDNVVTGQVGNALTFDGVNDYVRVPATASISGLTDVTVGGWFYPTTNKFFLTKYFDSTNRDGFVAVINAGGTITVTKYNATTNGIDGQSTTSTTIGFNKWSHIILNYNYTDYKWRVYINGTEASYSTQTAGRGDVYNDIYDLQIGARAGANNYFNGYIDETRLWNRTLSATEIANIYSNESIGQVDVNMDRTGLVGEWNMNESATSLWASTTPDTSGNNNHGSMINMVGANITDSSGNGNNGVTKGGMTLLDAGKYNQTFTFNGVNGYAVVPNSEAINFTNHNFTLNAWVYPISTFSGINGVVINKGRFNNYNTFALYLTTGASVRFQSANSACSGWLIASGTIGTIPTYSWSFLSVKKEGAVITGYINGAQTYQTTMASDTLCNNGYDLGIGAGSNSPAPGVFPASSFNGSIDEVMIFNRSLSADEIRELYSKGRANWEYADYQDITEKTANTGDYSEAVSCWIDGVTDSCGGGNNAVLYGNANWSSQSRGGIGNLTAGLDGSGDYINITKSQNFSTYTGITFAGWINGAIDGSQDIVLDGSSDYQFRIDDIGGGQFKFRMGNGTAITWYEVIGTNYVIRKDTWQHVVMTWDGSTITGYIDGASIGTKSMTGALQNPTRLFLGRYGGGAGYEWKGYLDDFAVWNRSLSADEVLALYRDTKQGRANDLTFTIDTTTTNVIPVVKLIADATYNFYTPYTTGKGGSITTRFEQLISNTCTWLGGTWLIKFADFCVITTSNNMMGNNVNVTQSFGNGTLNITGSGRIYNYTNFNFDSSGNNTIWLDNGGMLA